MRKLKQIQMYQKSKIDGFEMQPLQLEVMIATTKIKYMKESFYSCMVHTVPLALCKNEMIYHCNVSKTTN